MNKNRGIIGIGLILAIVLGIAVVGGGAYYLGKNGSKSLSINPENILPINGNNILPVIDSEKNSDIPSECNSNSPSTIKVISPNGGETYTVGQKITVNWNSCNINSGTTAIFLVKRDLSSSLSYKQAQGKNDHSVFSLDVSELTKVASGDRTQEITLPKDLVSGSYYVSISGTGDVTKIGSGYVPRDYSDNLFTINSSISASDLKTYTNKELGIEFKYPITANITEKKLGRTDLSSGDVITLSVPFKTRYDAWTSKGIDIAIHKSSCGDYLPTSMSQKKTINGISYVFEDPEWTATSGMSTISKWRKYFHEFSGKCYIISERISGLGNNERPSTYTFPSDVNKFLDEELLDLDKIMASVKIF